jgi:hypothetical protein
MADARGALGAGIGLRAAHVAEVLATRPAISWLEVHAENYLGGGAALRALEAVRRDHPISLHAVGLSLGSADGLDERHLARVAALARRIEPVLVSEHLSWSAFGGAYLNHLLPLPFTEETLELLCRNVDRVQAALGRRLLVENPASYLRFRSSSIPEPELLRELARRTGCGLLCDVNNLYVSCRNLGLEPFGTLAALPADPVGEIHLAGHTANDADGRVVLIDDHGSRVAQPVWDLYAAALARFGPTPTLVEWDANLPELSVLLEEARRAEALGAAARTGACDARAA